MDNVILVENLYKQYRLGQVSTGSISHDLNRWWHTVRGKEDPYEKITGLNNRVEVDSNEYVWALQDINFSVKQGEVLGIIGRNGAGKSTMLKILSKVTSPTKGNIKVKGRIASLLEVGTGFHPELTGRENIFLNGAILGMTKTEIRSKFDEIVAFSGVEKYIDTPVKRYSSGMYVRLAFAVAAHLEPEILIVDEVLAVGDAEFQKKCLGKMKDVSGEGRTVLFVSHNMSAVQKLCDNSLLLKNGQIKSYGKTTDVVADYLKNQSVLRSFYRQDNFKSESFITKGEIQEELNQINIKLNIESKVSISSSLDIRISDNQGNPVGFASFGALNEAKMLNLKSGNNEINFYLPTSKLAIGQYFLSFDLTIPDIRYIDRIENCLMFEVVRKPDNLARRVLMQCWGYGSVEIEINNDDVFQKKKNE
jgi:lipopolysaccharide transport system ATP-binding protein